MANTLKNTLNKVGDAIESILGAKNTVAKPTPNNEIMNQSCLERYGMALRREQLMRNEWRKDLEYSKPLVDAEYLIQTEFKVSSYEDDLATQEVTTTMTKQEKTNEKKQKQQKEKALKRNNKKNKDANSVQGGVKEDRPQEPQQIISENDLWWLETGAPYGYGLQ